MVGAETACYYRKAVRSTRTCPGAAAGFLNVKEPRNKCQMRERTPQCKSHCRRVVCTDHRSAVAGAVGLFNKLYFRKRQNLYATLDRFNIYISQYQEQTTHNPPTNRYTSPVRTDGCAGTLRSGRAGRPVHRPSARDCDSFRLMRPQSSPDLRCWAGFPPPVAMPLARQRRRPRQSL